MFRILHLSDLHARAGDRWSTDALLVEAKKTLLQVANDQNIDVIAFTGDIAFSGKPDEYNIAAEWIENFCLSTKGLNLDSSRLLFVPGNHDVDRTKITKVSSAIESTLRHATNIDDAAVHLADSNSIANLLERHSAYSDFCRRIRGDNSLSLPSWTQAIDNPGQRFVFEGYCSSWLCSGDKDEGRLLLGQPQITDRMNNRPDCDILVALVHHPLSHLSEFDENNFEDHLRANHTLLLRGHLHKADPVNKQAGTGGYLELAAGALHTRHSAPNSFSVVDISDDLQTAGVKVFTWSRSRWVQDRNVFPDSIDGVGRFEIRRSSQPVRQPSTTPFSSPEPIVEPQPTASSFGEVSATQRTKALDSLATFARFRHTARPQDLAIRLQLREKALVVTEQSRYVEIQAEWGADEYGFIASFVERWRNSHPELLVLHVRCGGATSGKQLQSVMELAAGTTLPDLAMNLRTCGPSIILLDDLGVSPNSDARDSQSVKSTLSTFLDFCPELVFVSTLPVSASIKGDAADNAIRLGPLDAAESRDYLEAHSGRSITLSSAVDYDRIRRATGGLPMHLDAVADALAYTDLNSALSECDTIIESVDSILPQSITDEIAKLYDAEDDLSKRSSILLSTLCILEQGELLSVVKRIIENMPLWPGHAKRLEELGLLDVIDTSPQSYEPQRRSSFSDSEKVLRVPRLVRDHVIRLLPADKQLELVIAAATLYFGADWRNGSVRMRRRPAFSPALSAHRFSNEMSLLRVLVFGQRNAAGITPENAMALLISYVNYLEERGFYGEAYEASREYLGMISNDNALNDREIEITEIQLVAGKCARMIGSLSDAVSLLSAALPNARRTKSRDRISDVLLSMAFAHESLGHVHDATKDAEEVIKLTSNNTADNLQAKAILAGFTEDGHERVSSLKRLHSRAKNHRHFTVADNIALDLAKEAGDTEEALRHLAAVRSRRHLEYNYVRATIRRIETLLAAGRLADVSLLDQDDLQRSYSLAYTQRLQGIFNWCHRVAWDYLGAARKHNAQRALFVTSSFLWRLNGDHAEEAKYAAKLMSSLSLSDSKTRDPVIRYCQSRLEALEAQPPTPALAT